jgi:hypothetical protein
MIFSENRFPLFGIMLSMRIAAEARAIAIPFFPAADCGASVTPLVLGRVAPERRNSHA